MRTSRCRWAFGRIALTSDGGWSYYLPRLVGLRRTPELVLENRALDAHEAADWSIVTCCRPPRSRRRLAGFAEGFAAGPSLTLRRLVRAGAQSALHDQLGDELGTIQASAATGDAMEATSAFLKRRAPQFRGA